MSQENSRVGLALGGAAIGAYFGVPGVGLAVGALAGGLLFPGKDPPAVLGARLDEMLQQTSTYGKFIPNIEGTYRVAGNVIWAEEIEERANSDSASGGKGGPPQPDSISFSYFMTMAIQLCEGPITGIRRVWMNDQLYTDLTQPSAGSPLNIRVYNGTETQEPDPTIEADKGVGQVPAFRGTAYVLIKDFPLIKSRNAPPVFHFEVVVNGSASIVTQSITDGGFGVSRRSVAIDPETNLVWVARGFVGEVKVFSCDGEFRLVKTFTHTSASSVAWCPGFVSVRSSLLAPNFILNPPRMWVASGTPDGLGSAGLQAYATDGTYNSLIEINSFDNSYFCWPGIIVVDKSSVSSDFPITDGVTVGIVGLVNGACSGMRAFQLDDTVPTHSQNFLGYNFVSGNHTSDFVEGELGIIYTIDNRGMIFKLQKGVPFSIPLDFLAVEYYISDQASGLVSGLGDRTLGNTLAFDMEEKTVYSTATRGGGFITDVRKWDSQLNLIWTVTWIRTGGETFLPDAIAYHEGLGDIWLFGTGTVNGAGFGKMHAVRISSEDGRVLEDLVTDQNFPIKGIALVPGAPIAIAAQGFRVTKIPLVTGASPVAPTLRDVLTRYCLRSGDLTAGDIDVSGIPAEDTVAGFPIPQRMPISNAMKPLLTAYFVDIVEVDGKVTFVKRGGSSLLTIPKEDLSARSPSEALPSPAVSTRTQDNELPRQLDMRFTNGANDYKLAPVLSHRLTSGSNQIRTVDFAIVFTPEQAQPIVDTLLFNMWNDRDPIDIVISRKYLQLVPTDVITIEHPEIGNITVRVNRVEYHFPQLIKIQVTVEDTSVYTGFTFPAPATLQAQTPFPATANLKMFVLDIPTLRDFDNGTGVYVGIYGVSNNFQPGEVFQSVDGLTYESASAIANESTVGTNFDPLTWSGSFK